ncbi:hypothetical protein EYR38_003576 [Pleurotus pulmonarius]|nr:hypothetical protein EYR38_003576 [Pleurotus pulmonarius]
MFWEAQIPRQISDRKSRPPDNFCFTLHVQISTVIMVWITNRSSETIKVIVTNPGGDPGTYEVVPEALLVESWRQNYWSRTTPETATVTFTKKGVQFKTIVNPKDVLLVYNDTYIIQPSTKVSNFLFGSHCQQIDHRLISKDPYKPQSLLGLPRDRTLMADWNDAAEVAKNATSSATLAHAFLGVYAGVMVFSLNVDWRYVRNIKQARVAMTSRFLNRYILLFALIGLTLTFDVAKIADNLPRRWPTCWVAINVLLILGLLAQAGLLSYAPVKATWGPAPRLGCIVTSGLGNSALNIRYTFVAVNSVSLFALAGWKYAALGEVILRPDSLSGQEVCCFGAACMASIMNIVFIWVDLDPITETITMTLPTIIISVASCRVIALWDDALREYAPSSLKNCGKPPSSHRHSIMSFVGWRVSLSGRPTHGIHKTPGFRRLSSTAGSIVGTSAPSSIILPSLLAPSPTYDPQLSQGPSSYLGSSGSDSSAQGDCYDPDSRRSSTHNIV